MSNLTQSIEEFFKSPRKTLESFFSENSLQELPQQLKNVFSFKYDDKPFDARFYELHQGWLKLLHDYYFKVEHLGHVPEVQTVTKKEKVIIISNHANTLEAAIVCYFFWLHQLGMVRTLVYKETFRLPFIRELFKSGQCIPVDVAAGTQALKKDHLLIFPEGMDFIKHYVKKDFVPKFHKGFLRIAREHLIKTGAKHVTLVPVGHDGIDYTFKFWVVRHPFIIENFVKPYLGFPFLVLPKTPFLFPTKTVFNWGQPRRVSLSELKDERSLQRLSHEFRNEILRLKNRARRLRGMEKLTSEEE